MVFGRLAGWRSATRCILPAALVAFPRRDLLHFSLWLVAQNFFVFLKDRAPDFIIGKFAGAPRWACGA